MPDLLAALLGGCGIQEAHTACRQLTGNYVKAGIIENTAQQVQPKEEETALAADVELVGVAET